MKFDKWTIGLAAIGVVSLASAARADEKVANSVQTALTGTTISGYVDTSAQWNFGTGNAWMPPYKFGGPTKADGFNLDVVQLTIAKPLDESEWASGYHVDLWFGPDANTLGTTSINAQGSSSDFAVRQAYVNLRTPVGNGLDWKLGVFDSPIGYESVESPNNPNYTRSYGHTMEPQTLTGALMSYHFNDILSASAGIANTVGPSIDSRAQLGQSGTPSGVLAPLWNRLYNNIGFPQSGANPKAESFKTYIGTVAVTAPDSMGFLSGSTLYGGIITGYNPSALGSGVGDNQQSYYVGATFMTPVTGLRFGWAFDYLNLNEANLESFGGTATVSPHSWATAGYVSYQATEKLSLHGRVEYTESKLAFKSEDVTTPSEDRMKIVATTLTAQYDLWKNVLSRVELRWDHSAGGNELFGGQVQNGQTSSLPSAENAWMLAANIIYKF